MSTGLVASQPHKRFYEEDVTKWISSRSGRRCRNHKTVLKHNSPHHCLFQSPGSPVYWLVRDGWSPAFPSSFRQQYASLPTVSPHSR